MKGLAYRFNHIVPVNPADRVVMMEWLDHRFLEWLIFAVVIALFLACVIWRMSFGARDDHRTSRKN
jgi:hypothetical protein